MKEISRRSFVAGAAAGVAGAGVLTGPRVAQAQLVYTTSDWKVAEFDKLVRHPATVKQIYNVIHIEDGLFLGALRNSLNGLHFGFGVPTQRIMVAAGLHGPANLLNFDDAIWSKYKIGEWLKVNDPATGAPATRNPFYASKAGPDLKYASGDPDDHGSLYQDTSIQGLQNRGVKFLSCHTATEAQARVLAPRLSPGKHPEVVVGEMLEHLNPDVLVVPSMVAAIALLQSEGHYSYMGLG